MKIKNLKINGFGKLENKEIEFSDGINVIKGQNESGKSTLLKFITSMFYGISKNKNGKFIPDFDRYKPWYNSEYSGKISYKLDNGEEYEIFREFKKKNPIIYNEAKDDISKQYQKDKNKENAFFIEQTGVTEENFFSTSVSEQENVKLTNNMKNSVIQKLSNIISTGSDNISYKKAIDQINKNQLENVGNQRSTGRPLNIIEEKIDKLEEEKKEIENYKNKKYQVEQEKNNLKTDLEETKEILNLLRKQKVNLEKSQLEEEKIKLLKQSLEQDLQKQKRLEEKINNIEETRQEKFKKHNMGYYVSIMAIIVITSIAIAMKKYYFLMTNFLPIGFIIGKAFINKKKKDKNKKEGKKTHQEKVLIEEEIETKKKEIIEKQKEINDKEEEIINEKRYLNELTRKEFIEKIDEEIIDDIIQTKYEKIIELIDEKEREQTEYKITEKTIEVDNENITKNLENLVEMDEELENLHEIKDDLLQLNDMYEMAKEEIQNSYQEMKENITPDFIEELKNILKKVTKGKYDNLYLDSDNNILIEIENGNYMPIEWLSVGTIDLIYLALRISATREITKEKMPIILDESLAYYDKERMIEILKYLNEEYENQILILTCSDRECTILEKENIKYNKIEI